MQFGSASQEVWPGSFAQVWAQVVVSPSPSLVKWPSCIWRPGGSSEGKHAVSLNTASCPVPLATGSALLPEHVLAKGGRLGHPHVHTISSFSQEVQSCSLTKCQCHRTNKFPLGLLYT